MHIARCRVFILVWGLVFSSLALSPQAWAQQSLTNIASQIPPASDPGAVMAQQERYFKQFFQQPYFTYRLLVQEPPLIRQAMVVIDDSLQIQEQQATGQILVFK